MDHPKNTGNINHCNRKNREPSFFHSNYFCEPKRKFDKRNLVATAEVIGTWHIQSLLSFPMCAIAVAATICLEES
jgi:hypothetical protein